MGDRTYDIGHVHVGRPVGPHAPMDGKWVCADNCPHPDHGAPDSVKPGATS